MKKIFFLLFFLCLFLVPANADYTVDSVSVTADVQEDGRTAVKTVLQLTFSESAAEVTVPLPELEATKISADGLNVRTDSTDDGLDLIVSGESDFLGTQTLQISYTVPYAGGGGEDADSFSLGLLSSRWAKTIPAVTFQVSFPRTFSAEPEVLSGYYGALSEEAAPYTVTGTQVSGTVTDLMAYDTLSLALTFEDGYFTVRESQIPGFTLSYLLIVMAAVWLLILIYWRAKIHSHRVPHTPRLLSPEGMLPCQLPMALDGSSCDVAATVLEWANLGYLTIGRTKSGKTVLIQRMHMGSERSQAEQILFRKIFHGRTRTVCSPGRFSSAAAKFRASAHRSLRQEIFDPKSGNPAIVQIPSQLLLAAAIGFLAADLLPEGTEFIVLAVVCGIAGLVYSRILHSALMRTVVFRRPSAQLIVCCVLLLALLAVSLLSGMLPELFLGAAACSFSGLFTACGPRRSARGQDLRSQAEGSRAFFRTVSWQRLQRLEGRWPRFFQAQLPNAVSLRMEKKFAKQFERLPIPMPQWLLLPQDPSRSASALVRQLAPIVRDLRRTFR